MSMVRRIVSVFVVIPAAIVSAQQRRVPATDLFDAVVGRLFQHVTDTRSTEVLLRYFCDICNTGEVQIVFRPMSNNRIQVDYWRLSSGEESIYRQLSRLLSERPTITLDQVAELIRVQHTS